MTQGSFCFCGVRFVLGSLTHVWNEVLADVRERIGDQRYNLWFKNTSLVSVGDDSVKVGVPNLFVRGWLEENFTGVLQQSTAKVLGREVPVQLVVDGALFREMRAKQEKQAAEPVSVALSRLDGSPPSEIAFNGAESSVNANLRLDNFVVGPCNRLAHAAALQIATQVTPEINPLFVHGACGLGKTHILQGIYNALTQSHRPRRAIYVSAEKWTNQFVCAIQANQMESFRRKYRSVDVLLIDDVHFLANKHGTQEEFIHTFNALKGASGCIVMASDSHPKMIARIKESLINRFLSGMIVKLNPPDYETRMDIVRAKAARSGLAFFDDAVSYVAEHFKESFREVEGAVTSVVAYARLMKRPVDKGLAMEALADLLGMRPSVVTLQNIEDAVTAYFQVRKADLHSRRRTKDISLPRQVCMYLGRQLTGASLEQIARFFGRDNHTTVFFAENKIGKEVERDAKLREAVESLTKTLKG
ncbi:MAG: chromosomal replication initiator protein DnaA [Planctomycetes bacterium]|nr:chromosomal replication initiator protein DnaA [Planctomycetota bacterium]